MNKVSLYIAKRYNTNTLLISMALISIVALLSGTLIYMVNVSNQFFSVLIYKDSMMSVTNRVIVYLLSFGFTIFQTTLIIWIFGRLLKRIKPIKKFLLGILISVFCGIFASILYFSALEQRAFGMLFSLFLISGGLLSLIYGSLSFLFSRKKITGVNIITSIAVFAITVATTALFIILSVFSGLEKMNAQLFKNVNPDLKISPVKGKILNDIDKITNVLDNNSKIATYSKVIEEKVSIEFDQKQDIDYLKGVDSNYKNVVKIDTTVIYGSYLDFKNPYEILVSDGVGRRLQLYIDHQHSSRLRMPRPGTGLIKNEEEAFNSTVAMPVGVFSINEQFDKFIFAPVELSRILLNLPENSAYSIEIKLKQGVSPELIKSELKREFGNNLKVETRLDLDATFLKVVNVEKLITYLIFTLVIIIASFNLAGSIIIIIIDKKEQIKTIWSFGLPLQNIKQIFFQTGFLITLFSVIIGLLQGTLIGWLQNTFHLVMATSFVAFPFEITFLNYAIVSCTVLFIGGVTSWLVSRKLLL